MDNNLLRSSVVLVNDRIHFAGSCRNQPLVDIDYTPPIGDGLGYTSLELLLLSLSSCAGSSVAILLRKMQRTLRGMEVKATGIRRQEHPTGFYRIQLEFIIESPDVQEEDFQKAVQVSEEKLCPVWNMMKGNVEISSLLILNRARSLDGNQ
jgi:putative redox protein